MQEYQSSDADLISQYQKNFSDFKTILKDYVQWHIEVIKNTDQIFIERFELQMGINVAERTLMTQK